MNNSSICSSKVNGVEKPKVRYKTAKAAFDAAKYLNSKPNLIHVFGEYKCLTCHYFHIGRTKKVKDSNPIYNQPQIEKPVTPKVEVAEKPKVDLFALIDPFLAPKKEVEQPVPTPVSSDFIEDEEEFDWSSDNKQIKKIDSYYDKLLESINIINN